ncbi:hypothetical protein [Enterobacter hormaechei]|uniref:hypothetical protein n=1 Tax=Enterobacter hormaechei TaxID=158836 RepID=UPI0018C265B6|nr:hypothetical protein [Enterobacter hormaechei]MBF9796150.1 hypothetical protein [Enterobacter hormaechei]
MTYYQVFFPTFFKINIVKYKYLHSCNARQGIEGAKENTWEQQSHIAPKRGAAAGERTRAHRPSLRPAKPNRPAGHDYADLRRRMPQLARA